MRRKLGFDLKLSIINEAIGCPSIDLFAIYVPGIVLTKIGYIPGHTKYNVSQSLTLSLSHTLSIALTKMCMLLLLIMKILISFLAAVRTVNAMQVYPFVLIAIVQPACYIFIFLSLSKLPFFSFFPS